MMCCMVCTTLLVPVPEYCICCLITSFGTNTAELIKLPMAAEVLCHKHRCNIVTSVSSTPAAAFLEESMNVRPRNALDVSYAPKYNADDGIAPSIAVLSPTYTVLCRTNCRRASYTDDIGGTTADSDVVVAAVAAIAEVAVPAVIADVVEDIDAIWACRNVLAASNGYSMVVATAPAMLPDSAAFHQQLSLRTTLRCCPIGVPVVNRGIDISTIHNRY